MARADPLLSSCVRMQPPPHCSPPTVGKVSCGAILISGSYSSEATSDWHRKPKGAIHSSVALRLIRGPLYLLYVGLSPVAVPRRLLSLTVPAAYAQTASGNAGAASPQTGPRQTGSSKYRSSRGAERAQEGLGEGQLAGQGKVTRGGQGRAEVVVAPGGL